jgi:RimJ/RimL family protein N-acetyltransferase
VKYQIRRLNAADAEGYHRVRLDALRLHPEAFGTTYEEEASLDRAQVVERLSMPGFARFGAFDEHGSLVGLAGLQIGLNTKQRHKGYLFSMYVDAAHRGAGIAQGLVEAVVAGAREAGAVVLNLTVTAGNAPAQRLYRRIGFTTYGVERRSLKVGDRFHDDELMALNLDRAD